MSGANSEQAVRSLLTAVDRTPASADRELSSLATVVGAGCDLNHGAATAIRSVPRQRR